MKPFQLMIVYFLTMLMFGCSPTDTSTETGAKKPSLLTTTKEPERIYDNQASSIAFTFEKDVKLGNQSIPAGTQVTKAEEDELLTLLMPALAEALKTEAKTDKDTQKAIELIKQLPKEKVNIQYLETLMGKNMGATVKAELNGFPEAFINTLLSRLQDELKR